MPAPNRIALYLTVAAGVLGALAPVVANLDISSVAGIAAGLAAISAVVYKWLDGWQKYEGQEVLLDQLDAAELLEVDQLTDEELAASSPTPQ
ncbi:MAG TPA: hypothetical protein VIS51_04305 [Solirubrobacterales bacterium]